MPDGKEYTLQDDDTHVVLASDGLWDHLSSDRVAKLVCSAALATDKASRGRAAAAQCPCQRSRRPQRRHSLGTQLLLLRLSQAPSSFVDLQISSGRETNAVKVANAVHRELVKQGGGFDDVTIVVAQLCDPSSTKP